MQKYNVLVEETLSKYVTVEAVDESDAVDIVQRAYDECRITLDAGDHSDTTIDTEYVQEAKADDELDEDFITKEPFK